MAKKCPTCLYTGKPTFTIHENYRIPIAGFFLGITIYWIPLDIYSPFILNFDTIFFIVLPITSLLIAAILIISYYNKYSKLCPQCTYGEMVNTENIKTE